MELGDTTLSCALGDHLLRLVRTSLPAAESNDDCGVRFFVLASLCLAPSRFSGGAESQCRRIANFELLRFAFPHGSSRLWDSYLYLPPVYQLPCSPTD